MCVLALCVGNTQSIHAEQPEQGLRHSSAPAPSNVQPQQSPHLSLLQRQEFHVLGASPARLIERQLQEENDL